MNALAPMPITLVRIADLRDARECARIDAFVAEHPQGAFFHRAGWTRGVEAGTGQSSHYLVAERRGLLTGCLPLTRIRSFLFGEALVSAGFATGGGILAESDEAARLLADAALNAADRIDCPSIELRGGPVPEGWARSTGTYANFSRPLPAREGDLLTLIPRRQRAEVRRAMDFPLRITAGREEPDRRAHYRVYAESVRNLGTPVFPRSLFAAVLDAFPGDDADIVTVWHEDRPQATLLAFYHEGVCHAYWGGGTREGRRWRANDLVWFELMRRAAARGCHTADFGRSKVGTGPWKRKRIWGFDETPLCYASWTGEGGKARDINPMSARYRFQVAAWQRLPLWAANWVGPILARGLG